MEKNPKNNIIVVHVAELIHLFAKRLWVIILAGIVFAAAGYSYAVMTKEIPMYMTTTKMYVTGVEAAVPSAAGINLGQQVLNNYIEILKSRPVLEQVIENLNLNMSYRELENCISENIPLETCMLEVSVTFPDPEWAKKVADELVVVSAERAWQIMGCTEPVVYEEAYAPEEPYNYSSSEILYTLLGGIGGVALACFVILLNYFANSKFDSPNKVTDKLHLKKLGVIPKASSKNLAYQEAAYQVFCSHLFFAKPDARVINFVSATEKENKYAFLLKAMESLQKMGKKVILLDTNLSNPQWGAGQEADTNGKGLEAYLTGQVTLKDIVIEKEGMAFIYCKEAVMNAAELLGGKSFSELLDQLKQEYDYILVDTAPLAYVPDALCAAQQADAVVLVLSGKTSRIRQAKEAASLLAERELPVVGAVLWDINIQKGGKYFRKEFGMYFGVYEK